MTKPVITTRAGKGSALTWTEGDTNLTNLRDATITVSDGTSSTAIDLNGTITFTAGAGISVDESTGTITISNTQSAGITDVVNDTTPQLGGTLDANGNSIDMGTNVITDTKVGNWDTAYGWGNHSSAGYLTTETYTGTLNNIVEDTTPQLGGTLDANGNSIDMGTNVITDTKVGNWDTAYGWGNHSVAGYLTTETYTGTVTSVGGTGTVAGLSLSGSVTSSGNLTLGGTLDLSSATVDGTNPIGYRDLPAVGTKTTSYSLTTSDVGKYVQVGSGGSITIPNSTFSEGDVVVIANNHSSAITITCSITTAYIAGTDTDKASVSLATRGLCNILFLSGTACIISGNVS